MKKQTSELWVKELLRPGEAILDPGGWDRKNYDYSFKQEEITKDEFRNRLCMSTVTIDIRSSDVFTSGPHSIKG